MAINLNVNDVVQLTLKTPIHLVTGTPANTGGSGATSQQTIKEFTGTVQNVDATTGIITVRGTVTVGSSTKQVDIFVGMQNLVAIARLV